MPLPSSANSASKRRCSFPSINQTRLGVENMASVPQGLSCEREGECHGRAYAHFSLGE